METFNLNPPVIYNYFNYRDYLNDMFSHLKRVDASYSHRKFLADAAIGGTAYLLRVLRGERKLSLKYVQNFSKALKHNTNEEHFFELMVRFENEKKLEQKDLHLKTLLKMRSEKGSQPLDDKKLQYLDKWYYSVIRDLVGLIDFKEDYNLLAKLLIPRINADQARNAVSFLLKNDFIKRRESGNGYEPVEPILSIEPDVQTTKLSKFHKKNLEIDIEAFENCSFNDRSISSVVVSVSEEIVEQMRTEIQEFRKKMVALARSGENPSMVYRIGFQMVPRAKVRKRNE
jgi:uncharacterized protein (TIGR02147 family)